MKKLMAMMLAGVMAVSMLAGCGGQTSDKEGSQPEAGITQGAEAGTTGQKDAAAGEKHLNIGYYQLATLDPAASSWETTRVGVGERLFKINDNMELEPWLIESYEQVNNLTWNFKVRDGIKFSNGKELTADAVKACLERTQEMNTRTNTMLNMASMEADGQNLTITTNEINAALPNNMADLVCTIVDVDSMEGENPVPVGTGPYVITSASDELYELEANKNYWNGTPKLDSITIKVFNDGNAMAMALDNGEVDMTFQLPTENIAQFEGRDEFVVSKTTGSRGQTMYFDFTNPLLEDLNVRKAITMAVDRETLANVVNKGNTEAATAIFPVSYPYGDVEGVAYDVEGAKKVLADAGYTDSDGDGVLDKDGKALSFKMYTYGSRGSVLPTMCEAMQSMLKEVGIAMDIQLNDYDPHLEILKAGGFDMALNSNIMAPVADPQYFADILMKTDADYNYGKYSNAEVDKLINRLDQEFDAEQRIALAKEIQEKIVEDCGFLELGHQKYQVVVRKNVTGYSTQGTELYLLNEKTDIN